MSESFDERMLAAIVPLREAGFALHWLHPQSKRPIGKEWADQPVASLEKLLATHKPGYNVGVRLGKPSQIINGLYLYVLDFDIRVEDTEAEALAAFKTLFPYWNIEDFPVVRSGSGGKSFHLYFLSDKPMYGRKLKHSETKHRHFDNEKKRDVWSWDWEIDLFGTGRQVVVPPSIHPNTKQPYVWLRPFDFDLLSLGLGPEIPSAHMETLVDAVAETYEFETREPLDFKGDHLDDVLDGIPAGRLDDYHDVITLGQALHHQFGAGEEGYRLWKKLRAKSEKYEPKKEPEWRRKYRGFGRNRRKPVTMATVIEWFKEGTQARYADMLAEVEEDTLPPDSWTMDELFGGSDDSSDADDLADIVVTPKDQASALGKVEDDPLADDDDMDLSETRESLHWTSLLAVSDEGKTITCLPNVSLIVANDPRITRVVQFNDFTQELVQRYPVGKQRKRSERQEKKPLQLSPSIWTVDDPRNGNLWDSPRDYDTRRIIEAPTSQGGYNMKISDRDLKAALVLAGKDNSFHPVKEYLEGLKWDGQKRVTDLFITYLGAPDNSYSRDVARLMCVAAVTRLYEPGHKFDFAVILEGAQGKRKSTFIRTIAKHWFSELDGDFHDGKEMVEKMQGSWILEMPELSGFNRADVRSIKAFISRQFDKVRLAYDARASVFKRQCVLIGSTNDQQYLKDDTGGRRFLPIPATVESIDIDTLSKNIDQIWAEAYVMYREMRKDFPIERGELPLYLSDSASAAYAATMQEERRVETVDDDSFGLIAEWLTQPIVSGDIAEDGPEKFRTSVCLKQLWVECLGNEAKTYNMQAAAMLGRVMGRVCTEMGWKRRTHRQRLPAYGLQIVYDAP